MCVFARARMSRLFETVTDQGPFVPDRMTIHKAKVYRTWIPGNINGYQQQNQKTPDIGL